jgi:transcriptional regulator of arginine metabolism
MAVKASRQRALAALLRSRKVSSQARLLELLRVQGFDATQATVSRDLEELGATKVRGSDGQLVYALPDADGAPEVSRRELAQILSMFMLSAVPSGNLVVLRTPPGHAQALASAMDRAGLPDVAGTVAGDDTVLVVCADRTSGRAMARQLRELIAGRGAAGGDGSSPRQTTSAGRAAPTGLQLIYRGESA